MRLPRRYTSLSPQQAQTIVTVGFLFGLALVLGAMVPMPAFAASPWENAVDALQTSMTGPIARGLSLVSIVIGGLSFAFAEGDSKRMLAGILFGVGMAIGAVNFLTWLFPS